MMAKQLYNHQGDRVKEVFSTGSALEVYVWDGTAAVEIWPSAKPTASTVLNLNDPDPVTTKSSSGLGQYEQSSTEFFNTQGIFRVSWQQSYPGSTNDWGTINSTDLGNNSRENFGLNQDYAVQNIASLSWAEGTPSTPTGVTRTMNLKWYDPTPADGADWDFRAVFPTNDDYNEDPSWQAPTGPYQIPCDMRWYGERLLLGEATGSVSSVTASYVYNNGSNTWPWSKTSGHGDSFILQAPLGLAPYVRVNRNINDFGESPLAFVERTGRHIVTIERHEWDPGTEYIIAGRDYAKASNNFCYYVHPPRAKNSSSSSEIIEVPIIQYSDNPLDRSQLIVTTGETLTYRIYEDIL